MNKFYVVIVIYNKNIEDSITIKSIMQSRYSNFRCVIVDNSVANRNNELYCKKNNYLYLTKNCNLGLSKAYNLAINNIDDSDFIILFDDDTNVPKDYFEKLNNYIDKNDKVDIFAPVVYGQDNVIYSPNEFNFLKNKLIKSPKQKIDEKKFNAIASCLAIKKEVFANYRFNEKLFIDQVDQYFFCEQRNIGRLFMKMDDVFIIQNFYQRDKKISKQVFFNRFSYRVKDIFVHAKLMNSWKYIFLSLIKNFSLAFVYAIKLKSLIFFIKTFFLSIFYFVKVFYVEN